jgi:hypothetical protein
LPPFFRQELSGFRCDGNGQSYREKVGEEIDEVCAVGILDEERRE